MPRVAPRLYRGFQPDNYSLRLEIDPDKLTFLGHVTITGRKVGQPTKRLVLHQKDLKVTAAKVFRISKSGEDAIEIKRINCHKSFDELRLHTDSLLRSGDYRIEVEFSGQITEAMHGIYPCYFDQRRKKLIATQLESHHAREVFPCIDEPEAKATFDLKLVTPKTTVIANTPIKHQEIVGDLLSTQFEPTPRMSTYLLAFVCGEVVFKEAQTKRGLKVRAYGTPLHRNSLDFALDTATRCIDFFENYFGVEYPLTKLDMIGLPDFSSGAMENWGLVTFRESIFFADPKTTSVETKQLIALVVNHELSHQWFGNLVTMKWWDDLWLNESFANLMEYVATDNLYPEWRIWELFVNNELNPALRRDALPHVQAIRTKVNHPDELATLFDPAIVYAKGGSVLNMLRHQLGEDIFRRGLKLYFDKHAYGNTEASDLWEALGQASGQDIGAFMDKWLTQSGYPVVDIDLADSLSSFSASQRRLVVGGEELKSSSWPVPLLPHGQTKNFLLNKPRSRFDLSPGANDIFFNDEGRSYFVPRYLNQKHWQALTKSVEKGKASTINRLNLLIGQILLERALLTSTADNLELIRVYENEDEDAVWGAISTILGEAKRLVIGQQPFESTLNKFIERLTAQQVDRLGWQARRGEAAQTLKLRNLILSLAAAAEAEDVLTHAKKMFANFKQPADLAPDVRDVVYYVAARFGSQADFDKLLDLYKNLENADERNEVAGALTSTHEPKQIKTLLTLMTTETVRLQDVDTWYIWLLRNHRARTEAWQWLKDHWPWIESKFASDKSYDNFVKYTAAVFSHPEELTAYQDFFNPKRKTIALTRAIDLGIEEIEARVKWRLLNEQPTKDLLANGRFSANQ